MNLWYMCLWCCRYTSLGCLRSIFELCAVQEVKFCKVSSTTLWSYFSMNLDRIFGTCFYESARYASSCCPGYIFEFHVCPGGEDPQGVLYDFVKLFLSEFASHLWHLCLWSCAICIFMLSGIYLPVPYLSRWWRSARCPVRLCEAISQWICIAFLAIVSIKLPDMHLRVVRDIYSSSISFRVVKIRKVSSTTLWS